MRCCDPLWRMRHEERYALSGAAKIKAKRDHGAAENHPPRYAARNLMMHRAMFHPPRNAAAAVLMHAPRYVPQKRVMRRYASERVARCCLPPAPPMSTRCSDMPPNAAAVSRHAL